MNIDDLQLIKFRDFSLLDGSELLPSNAENHYHQTEGDEFIVGYRVNAESETGTNEPEFKMRLSDLRLNKTSVPHQVYILDQDIFDILKNANHTDLHRYIFDQHLSIYTGTERLDYGLLVERTEKINNVELYSHFYVPIIPESTDPVDPSEPTDLSTLDIALAENRSTITLTNNNESFGNGVNLKLDIDADQLVLMCDDTDISRVTLPSGGDPGGGSGEAEIEYVQPNLERVLVSTHDGTEDPTATGSFEATEGDNAYNLTLDLPVLQGIQGVPGNSTTVTLGTTTTIASGSDARVENVGTEDNMILNFYIPQGSDGTSIRVLSQEDCRVVGDGFIGDGESEVTLSGGIVTTTIYGHLYWLEDPENHYYKDAGNITGRGIKNVLKTNTVGNTDTYTITYTDNTTSTYTITNGKNIVCDVTQAGEKQIRVRYYTTGDNPAVNCNGFYFTMNEAGNKFFQCEAFKYENGDYYRTGNAILNVTDGQNGVSVASISLPENAQYNPASSATNTYNCIGDNDAILGSFTVTNGEQGASLQSVEVVPTDDIYVYDVYVTIAGDRTKAGSFTIPESTATVDHHIICHLNTTVAANNASGHEYLAVHDTDDRRCLHQVNISDTVTDFSLSYCKNYSGHDDYIIINNKNNTKDLNVHLGNFMHGSTYTVINNVFKPTLITIPAGSYAELFIKIMEYTGTHDWYGYCSVYYPEIALKPSFDLYNFHIRNLETNGITEVQSADYNTDGVLYYQMPSTIYIDCKKWNKSTEQFEFIDTSAAMAEIASQSGIVDVTPADSSDNVARNLMYGLFATYDKSLYNSSLTGYPNNHNGFNFYACRKITNPITFDFNIKSYYNL